MLKTFMPWILHLPELGDPIRAERERLAAKLQEAHELERQAARLVQEVRAGEQLLMAKVTKSWSLFDIESAGRRAGAEGRTLALSTVRDAVLRAALQAGDEHLTAGQAVRIFGDADVIDIDALSLASAQERTETLERVAAWWNFAGRHVYARLQDDQATDRPAHQQAAFT